MKKGTYRGMRLVGDLNRRRLVMFLKIVHQVTLLGIVFAGKFLPVLLPLLC